MDKLFKDLFMINRSLAGKENRKTLQILKDYNKELKINSFPSRKKIEKWIIPDEWAAKEAYIMNSKGEKLIDYKNNYLHLPSHSNSFEGYLNAKDLKKNLFVDKKLPNAIPYKTFYYNKEWGFCISKNQLDQYFKNPKEKFYVKIDTKFKKGIMNYGEFLIKGESQREILFSTYICHPNMANNELSGPVLASKLIKFFKKKRLRYSMRFLFIPETIGAIAYLNKNYSAIKKNFLAGFILTCLSGPGRLTLLESRNKNSLPEKYAIRAIKSLNLKFKKISFIHRGSDERQFCWPNINFDFISLMHSKYLEYDEYHTSEDNLSFLNEKSFDTSLKVYKSIVNKINLDYFPLSKTNYEPKLDTYMNYKNNYHQATKINLFLSYCDGKNNLFDIANITKIEKSRIKNLFLFCLKNDLIEI